MKFRHERVTGSFGDHQVMWNTVLCGTRQPFCCNWSNTTVPTSGTGSFWRSKHCRCPLWPDVDIVMNYTASLCHNVQKLCPWWKGVLHKKLRERISNCFSTRRLIDPLPVNTHQSPMSPSWVSICEQQDSSHGSCFYHIVVTQYEWFAALYKQANFVAAWPPKRAWSWLLGANATEILGIWLQFNFFTDSHAWFSELYLIFGLSELARPASI